MEPIYDRLSELKAFDESKAGVKGLVDAGVTKIPRIFIHDQKHQLDHKPRSCDPNIKLPTIDLQSVNNEPGLRAQIVEQVGTACEKWGFFQVINHGIPEYILDQVIDGIRRFHEQDVESKKEYYSRDYSKRVLYNSNFDLFEAPAACWRDTLTCIMGSDFPRPEELPAACRDIMIIYKNEVLKLGYTVYELMSEALGLDPNYLKDMGCAEGIFVPCHYYPSCLEPELTIGLKTHADVGFITVLLQDQVGGLQVLHENQWVDAVPLPGSLVVNVGLLIQLITNDRFQSAYHRVVAKNEGPRISVACIFRAHSYPENTRRNYGPIKELLSEKNPPLYPEITIKDIVDRKYSKSTGEVYQLLAPFKL